MKTILAIDGGGVRGLIPAMILQEIEKRTNMPISELFDVVAGTSTGGILASTISAPGIGKKKPKYTASDMCGFYKTLGSDVFQRSLWHKIKTGWGLWGSKYISDGPRQLTKKLVGDLKLTDGLTDIVVTAYDLEKSEPYLISSLNPDHKDLLMEDAVLSTTCVPAFFPPMKKTINNREVALVDGSIFAVDPALCGYKEAYEEGEEILMISLGTGETKIDINHEKCKKWGFLQWFFSLKAIEIIFDGSTDSTGQIVKSLIEKNSGSYYRVQAYAPAHMYVSIDSTSRGSIDKTVKLAEQCIKENHELINEICRKLILAHLKRKLNNV